MKTIIIKNENISRIQAAMDAAQPRARVRTIDAADVLHAIERIVAACRCKPQPMHKRRALYGGQRSGCICAGVL